MYMYKVKNIKTLDCTTVHTFEALQSKAIQQAMNDLKGHMKTEFNIPANWKVINYSSDNYFDMKDSKLKVNAWELWNATRNTLLRTIYDYKTAQGLLKESKAQSKNTEYKLVKVQKEI